MRIIHLTDLHLRHHLPGTSSNPGRDSRLMPAMLERALSLCQTLHPDFGVLSGDVVDVPAERASDPDTQAMAWDDLQLVRDLLGATTLPWVVLPGNHDLAEQVRRAFSMQMDWALGDYRVLSFDDQERSDHVPERAGLERARLDMALVDADDRPQVHVQHYVLCPRLDATYPHTYADGDAMSEMIAQSRRVRLALSGHYHPGVPPFRVSSTWFSVAPALCVSPYPVMVYDLDPGGLSWRRIDLGETA